MVFRELATSAATPGKEYTKLPGYSPFANMQYSPRLIRMVKSTNFSVHDLILVDCKTISPFSSYILSSLAAPEFHLVVEAGSNGEVYNMAIRGT